MTDVLHLLSSNGRDLLVHILCSPHGVQGWELGQPNSGGDGACEALEGPDLWAGGQREGAGRPEGAAGGEHPFPQPRSPHQNISFYDKWH